MDLNCPYLIRHANYSSLIKTDKPIPLSLEGEVDFFCAYIYRKCEEDFCVNCEIYQDSKRRLETALKIR